MREAKMSEDQQSLCACGNYKDLNFDTCLECVNGG